ncbi:hypothetical protein P8452_12489 [Trifolium repens]|nr:hypothetical protein P8452_12489 [Trifolium repens]
MSCATFTFLYDIFGPVLCWIKEKCAEDIVCWIFLLLMTLFMLYMDAIQVTLLCSETAIVCELLLSMLNIVEANQSADILAKKKQLWKGDM